MMKQIITKLKPCLSSYQIKWIALIFMTLDHFGHYFYSSRLLWRIGVIAAPLFLYMITESARHTSNRKRFLLRLYIAAAGVGLFRTLVSTITFNTLYSAWTPGNILSTFFYTVLYIYMIEHLVDGIKKHNGRTIGCTALALVVSFVPTLLNHALSSPISNLILAAADQNSTLAMLAADIIDSLLPSLLWVEYSPFFILLGILLYFAGTKRKQCVVLLCYCILYFAAKQLGIVDPDRQHWMVLALPFMLLYNGKRGRAHKSFFYLYYPLHNLLFYLLSHLF